MMRPQYLTVGFAVIVCRHPDGRWLAVKETKNRGWWLPAGGLEAGETFPEAAIRETFEEAGINVQLKGILRVEHSICSSSSARMRVVFYAEPIDPLQPPKSVADSESEMAFWATLEQLADLAKKPPGFRGPELLEWANYIESGGVIAPLHIFGTENDPVPTVSISKSDPNTVINWKKWTLLHAAVNKADEKAVIELLAKGANIAAKTHKGRNVVHFAVQSTTGVLSKVLEKLKEISETERVEILNAKDEEGNTPLHFAAKYKGAEVYKLLIEYGADINVKNDRGKTPQDLLVITKQ